MGFDHRQQQGALPVVKRHVLQLLGAIVDLGHLRQSHIGAALASHDDVAKVLGALHARLHLHHAVLLNRTNRAHWQVLVFVADGGHHLVCRHAQRFHGLRIQVEVDFAFGATYQGHRAHATHVFKPLLEDLVCPVGQLHIAQGLAQSRGFLIRQYRHRPNRAAGGVKAQDARLFHIGAQKWVDIRDFFAHIISGFATIDIQLKLNHHHRQAFVTA